MDLDRLFCDVDDFCKHFVPCWEAQLLEFTDKKRCKPSALCLSEVMTIIIAFHQSGYRTFKHYYLQHISRYRQAEFPDLVSYNRFVELMGSALIPLCAYLNTRKGKVTGISFIDSTMLRVCYNRRIKSNKVFKNIAKRGKTSVGWSP